MGGTSDIGRAFKKAAEFLLWPHRLVWSYSRKRIGRLNQQNSTSSSGSSSSIVVAAAVAAAAAIGQFTCIVFITM